MLKIIIFSGFMIFFILFWGWILFAPSDIPGPIDRI